MEQNKEMLESIETSIGEIKPFLQRDGGDIEFVELTPENVVKVKLQGACSGCPGAAITLQAIVERIIKEAVPEVAGVEAV
jgi:Fe-S cluster biogenesis protein NfuA